jgi:hypothetical protein
MARAYTIPIDDYITNDSKSLFLWKQTSYVEVYMANQPDVEVYPLATRRPVVLGLPLFFKDDAKILQDFCKCNQINTFNLFQIFYK